MKSLAQFVFKHNLGERERVFYEIYRHEHEGEAPRAS